MAKLDNYNLICGLEIHAELKTNSKMFCSCKNDPFAAPKPNMYTCPVCLGMPGGLPVANKKAIEWTIKLGLALGCEINLFSKFDRKNYFYPDLPKGYQISQYDIPFCYNGEVETSEGPIKIRRIHLEEDTGKLLHKKVKGKDVSLIDFNRSGVPLIEIVTEPDIKSPAQAKEYGRKLRQILRYLDISDADMEQGGMRLEANISLQEKGATELPNYKVEVKNINSFRFVESAIEYEMKRHAEMLDNGTTPAQETRGWNPDKGETFSQRTKEEAEDYRYFPDPDLPPIHFTKEKLAEIANTIPELADEKMERWKSEFGIEEKYAVLLTNDRTEAQWAEEVFKAADKEKLAPNDLANAIVNKKISVQSGEDANTVISSYKKLTATADISAEELQSAIETVMENNPDAVEKYRHGEKQVLGFFIGQTINELGKKADANEVREALQNALQN